MLRIEWHLGRQKAVLRCDVGAALCHMSSLLVLTATTIRWKLRTFQEQHVPTSRAWHQVPNRSGWGPKRKQSVSTWRGWRPEKIPLDSDESFRPVEAPELLRPAQRQLSKTLDIFTCWNAWIGVLIPLDFCVCADLRVGRTTRRADPRHKSSTECVQD
jgi:hypothetical protein